MIRCRLPAKCKGSIPIAVKASPTSRESASSFATATNGLSPKIRTSMIFPFFGSTNQSRSGLRGRVEGCWLRTAHANLMRLKLSKFDVGAAWQHRLLRVDGSGAHDRGGSAPGFQCAVRRRSQPQLHNDDLDPTGTDRSEEHT